MELLANSTFEFESGEPGQPRLVDVESTQSDASAKARRLNKLVVNLSSGCSRALQSSEAKPAPAGKLSTHGSAPLPSTPADSGANKEDIDTNNTQQAPAPAGSPPLKGCENDEDCAEPAHLDVEANPTGSDSDPVFDPSVLRAEEQAEKLRKASAPQKPAKELTGDNVKALDVLLDKAAIFSNFVKDGINDQIATLNQTDEPAPVRFGIRLTCARNGRPLLMQTPERSPLHL